MIMNHVIIDGFNTTKVDVSDLAYQANKAYLPDKTDMWKDIPVSQDGWVLAHDAIRFEIKELKRAIAAVGPTTALERWQADAVKSWIAGHLVHVHEHHHNEDDIFNPYLRQRIIYPDKLEADHVDLVELMDTIKSAAELAPGDTLQTLSQLWLTYESLMLPHLHEEEVVGLPLARAYFTPAEIGKVVSSFVKNGDPISLGSFVHAMGRKKDAQAFMKREKIPSFVWHIPGKGFKALRTLYRKKMQSHIDSLVAGRIVSSIHTPKSAKGFVTVIADSENVVAQAVSPPKQARVQVLGAR